MLRATEVTVTRLKQGPNKYENERIEIRITVPEGFTGEQAVVAGRAFLSKQFGEAPSEEEVAKAKAVVASAVEYKTL